MTIILQSKDIKLNSTNTASNISPWFWTGLIDAEGSFTILIVKDSKRLLGWRVELKFQLGLHKRDLCVLEALKEFFGVGKIYKGSNNQMNFIITRFRDIKILVAHLIKYPLQTHKYSDFLLFKAALDIILSNKHLTTEGLQEIVNLKASINLGLSNMLKERFPNFIPATKSVVSAPLTLNPLWILGFFNGDGSFGIRVTENPVFTTGYRVQLRFRITQHIRDKALLQSIVKVLDCGTVNDYKNGQNAVTLNISSFSDITLKIIPLIENGVLLGDKQKDYICWKKAHDLMRKNQHLTIDGINEIKKLKSKMISGRLNMDD